MTLGRKIAESRKAKGWTQGQLADKVGVHPSHITRWERDRNQPAVSTLSKLAESLGVSIEEFTSTPSKRVIQESLQDDTLLSQFKSVQDLDERDRSTIMHVIDAFLVKRRMEKAMGIVPA